MTPQEFVPKIEVKLDWRAYFARFCEVHGDPVAHEGRFLFADGWTYSATDWKGPEWQPDETRMPQLALAYWRLRKKVVLDELNHVNGRLNWLRTMQTTKSAPLQQRVKYRSEDDEGRPMTVSEVQDLDLGALEERSLWLTNDLVVCDLKLKEHGDANRPIEPVYSGPGTGAPGDG